MVQGGVAESEFGFDVAQEKIGPVPLLLSGPVAQRNQAPVLAGAASEVL